MRVDLTRIYHGDDCTIGVMEVMGELVCYTLENPWLDNKRNISCIPPGQYKCKPFSGNKFHDVWQLINVPGRKYILIHMGNFESDTQGCILPGMSYGKMVNYKTEKEERAVKNSRVALEKLTDRIGIMNSFYLNITEVQCTTIKT